MTWAKIEELISQIGKIQPLIAYNRFMFDVMSRLLIKSFELMILSMRVSKLHKTGGIYNCIPTFNWNNLLSFEKETRPAINSNNKIPVESYIVINVNV